jgi:hypothetical protein
VRQARRFSTVVPAYPLGLRCFDGLVIRQPPYHHRDPYPQIPVLLPARRAPFVWKLTRVDLHQHLSVSPAIGGPPRRLTTEYVTELMYQCISYQREEPSLGARAAVRTSEPQAPHASSYLHGNPVKSSPP